MAGISISSPSQKLYQEHVNPQWVHLLDVLQMNVTYNHCRGVELFTSDGIRKLDCLSGYCVYNVGHNHPRLIDALTDELARCGPTMLQSHVPELAGELAARLCALAGGRVNKAFFPNSGSEGVEAAIKFSRAATGREALLYCAGGFHGLTCGALSLMSNPFWRDDFGPMLANTTAVLFDDLATLEKKLASRSYAAFITEPIQSEAGINVPTAEYMQQAEALCRRYGTLFVLDEVQTGLHRTGPFLAAHHYGVEPDIVILAKALSGGLVPCAAVLMSDEVCSAVYSSVRRAFIHTSTFSENGLAMRAGLATLDVLADEHLGLEAARKGRLLRELLEARLCKYEMFRAVRGKGLLNGIEFQAPSSLGLKISYAASQSIHAGLFGQMLVMRLFRNENILSQICGNNFMVLKVNPPLTVSEGQIDEIVDGISNVVEDVHSSSAFWTDAFGLAQRALKS
jgi:ornithine--oxo-acid transaminase